MARARRNSCRRERCVVGRANPSLIGRREATCTKPADVDRRPAVWITGENCNQISASECRRGAGRVADDQPAGTVGMLGGPAAARSANPSRRQSHPLQVELCRTTAAPPTRVTRVAGSSIGVACLATEADRSGADDAVAAAASTDHCVQGYDHDGSPCNRTGSASAGRLAPGLRSVPPSASATSQ